MLKQEELQVNDKYLKEYNGAKIITPEGFKELSNANKDIKVIGRSYLKSVTNLSKKDTFIENITLNDGNNYPVFKDYKSGAIGFIHVGNNKFVAIVKHKKPIAGKIATVAVIAVVGVGAIFALNNQNDKNTDDDSVGQGGVAWNENTGNESDNNDNDQIAIPGYVTQKVSEEEPIISLGNPKRNDVYFVYHEYNSDENEIYTSDNIAPGMKIEWNAYNDIEDGTNTYKFLISTYDMNDISTPYNSAEMQVEIIKQ